MTDVRSKNPFELLGDEEETAQTTTKLTRNEKKILKNEVIDNSRATPRENRLRNDYPKRGGFAGKSSEYFINLILFFNNIIFLKFESGK